MTAAPGRTDRMGRADLIEWAANVLAWRGYLETDDEGYVPDEVVTELTAIYNEGACGTCIRDYLTVDALADHFLARKQEEYERSIPTWTCECGTVYKVVEPEDFYELGPDGLLGDQAGGVRRDSKGKVKHSDNCKKCDVEFAKTIDAQLAKKARDEAPQGSLF